MLTLALVVTGLSLAGNVGLGWLLVHFDRRRSEAFGALYADYRQLQDRLYTAWKEGAVIPPAPEPPEPPLEPLATISRELAAWVQQWEGEEAQAAWEKRIRRLLRSGRTPASILLELEEPVEA